jgi:hypothetical protein
MAEIKARSHLTKKVGEGRVAMFSQPARVEFVYLQFRKIIELIAMGSLLANAETFSQVQSNLQKYWNVKDLLKDIHAINPDFYPRPIIQTPSNQPGVKMEWLDQPDDYLTKDRFMTLYDKCGRILHARNPFAPERDHAKLEAACPKWYLWIINLLNAHTIRLVGDVNLYLIQMGNDSSAPTSTVFAPSQLPQAKRLAREILGVSKARTEDLNRARQRDSSRGSCEDGSLFRKMNFRRLCGVTPPPFREKGVKKRTQSLSSRKWLHGDPCD